MSNVNIGTGANTGTGDNLRDAFIKVNENFDEVVNDLSGKLDQNDLERLNNSIDGKANLIHTHTISQINGLTASLAGKADVTSVNADISSINNTISTINSVKIDEAPIDGFAYVRKDGQWRKYDNNFLVYTALISQESTLEPTAIVLSNNTGVDIKFSYKDVGEYIIYVSDFDLFIENKTFILYQAYDMYKSRGTTTATFRWKSTNEICMFVERDDKLRNASLEIRIYS